MAARTSARFADSGLVADYAAALAAYVAATGSVDGAEESLAASYEIGRRALAAGVGLLDLLQVHRVAAPSSGERELVFLAEALAPFEMTHRAFAEANSALRHLNDVLEAEVNRLARELHDESGQLLAAARIEIDQIALPAPSPGLDRLRGVLANLDDHLRGLAHDLRPTALEDLGLVAALHAVARSLSRRGAPAVEVAGTLPARPRPDIETAVYRAVTEALTNAVRHARATRIRVHLTGDDGALRCAVRDDGVGFDLQDRRRRGIGLAGMRERIGAVGGSLTITSGKAGTEVAIEVQMEREKGER
jgi:two-component system NarL family sensor kinase